MIVSHFQSTTSVKRLLSWVDLPKSSFHYKPSHGQRGAKPSTYTLKEDGTLVDNLAVIEEIKEILSQEFCCYGYHTVTDELRDKEYMINPKKVYRLMDENHLLLGKVIRTTGRREFVRHRKIEASRPLEYLCLDIKYVWVQGDARNYYLLTVMDVYTRIALEQIFQKSIRKIDVINVFRKINNRFGIKGVTIRNDNGSQFIANDVKQFLRVAEARQEFTHIATPQENSYIESFHSIVQREVIDRFEFHSFYEAKSTIAAHRDWYNNRRRHTTLGMTPAMKWAEYSQKNPQWQSLEQFNEELINTPAETVEDLRSHQNPEANSYICLQNEFLKTKSYTTDSHF